MRQPAPGPLLFIDCARHAPEVQAELFVVEGESAARAVAAVRNPEHQAVLALQGKPVNALRASRRRTRSSPALAALTAVLGSAPGTALPLGDLRYARILLLMDPDADGIHAAALVQIFLLQTMRPLLESSTVSIVHAPWGEIRTPGRPTLIAWHEAEFQRASRTARQTAGEPNIEAIRYRGLGAITPSLLRETCVSSETRLARKLTVADAEDAARVFG